MPPGSPLLTKSNRDKRKLGKSLRLPNSGAGELRKGRRKIRAVCYRHRWQHVSWPVDGLWPLPLAKYGRILKTDRDSRRYGWTGGMGAGVNYRAALKVGPVFNRPQTTEKSPYRALRFHRSDPQQQRTKEE